MQNIVSLLSFGGRLNFFYQISRGNFSYSFIISKCENSIFNGEIEMRLQGGGTKCVTEIKMLNFLEKIISLGSMNGSQGGGGTTSVTELNKLKFAGEIIS